MRPAHIIDGRAGSSVLAVQAVSIEEHEVSDHGAFHLLVDSKQSFHRRSRAAFCLRIEHTNAYAARGLLDDRTLGFSGRSLLSFA